MAETAGEQISDKANQCLSAFNGVIQHSNVSKERMSWAEDQRARFNLWTESLGVFAEGRLSVEERLRFNAAVGSVISRLLEAVLGNLQSFKRISCEHESTVQTPSEEHDPQTSRSRHSTSAARPLIDSATRIAARLHPDQDIGASGVADTDQEDEETPEAIQEDVQNDIGRLIRLATLLRQHGAEKTDARGARHEPLDDEGNSLIPAFKKQIEEAYKRDFDQGIQSQELVFPGLKFPIAEFLKDRLLETTVKRWCQMSYRIRHANSLAQKTPLEAQPKVTPQFSVATEHLQPASAIGMDKKSSFTRELGNSKNRLGSIAPSKATSANASFKLPKALSVVQSSVGSNMKSGHLDLPRRPNTKPGAKEYQCPFCRYLRPVSDLESRKKWAVHVFHDLRPYICLVANCKEGTSLYRRMEEWEAHMKKAHFGPIWTCQACKKMKSDNCKFDTQESYIDHIDGKHPDLKGHLPTLLEFSRTEQPLFFANCPLCGEQPGIPTDQGESHDTDVRSVASQQALLHHIAASHLKPFALHSLPWDIEEADAASSGKDVDVRSRHEGDEEAEDDESGLEPLVKDFDNGDNPYAATLKDIDVRFPDIEDVKQKSVEWRDSVPQDAFLPDTPRDLIREISTRDIDAEAAKPAEPLQITASRDADATGTSQSSPQETLLPNLLTPVQLDPTHSPPERSLGLSRAISNDQVPHIESFLDTGEHTDKSGVSDLTTLQLESYLGSGRVVKKLIDRGANIDAAHEELGAALHLAIYGRQRRCFELLVEAGATLNSVAGKFGSPLHAACIVGDVELVQFLLDRNVSIEQDAKVSLRLGETLQKLNEDIQKKDKGVPPNVPSLEVRQPLSIEFFKCQPLFIATWYGHSSIAQALVGKGADIEAESYAWFTKSAPKDNIREVGSLTALSAAAVVDRADLVSWLVEVGAKVDRTDSDDDTPAMTAAGLGNMNALTAFHQANVDLTSSHGTDNHSPLSKAVESGHVDCLRFLISHGCPIEGKSTAQMATPLIWAAFKDKVDCLRVLIEHGAVVDEATKSGETALMLAADKGHLEALQLLLDSGASHSLKSVYNNTALNLAAAQGHYKCIRTLIEFGASIDFAGNLGRSAIMEAARRGDADIVLLLAEKGASLSLTSANGMTALHLAAYYGHADCVRLLADRGDELEARDKWGDTPLLKAASQKHTDCLRTLVEHGASPDQDNEGLTALHLVVKNGDVDGIAILRTAGASLTKEAAGLGCPLEVAASKGLVECLRALLIDLDGKQGADPNMASQSGETALMICASEGYRDGIQLLIDHGADWTKRDKNGDTAASRAVKRDTADCLAVLLDAGAPIDEVDDHSRTLLWNAASSGKEAVTGLLLARAADKDAVDRDGDTPSMAAASNGHAGSLKLLIDAGADITVINHTGRSALIKAAGWGRRECLRLLTTSGAALDSVDNNGINPVTAAIISQEVDCINTLVAFEAPGDLPRDFNSKRNLMNLSAVIDALLKSETDVESDSEEPELSQQAHEVLESLQKQVQVRIEMLMASDPSRTLLPKFQDRLKEVLSTVRDKRGSSRRAPKNVSFALEPSSEVSDTDKVLHPSRNTPNMNTNYYTMRQKQSDETLSPEKLEEAILEAVKAGQTRRLEHLIQLGGQVNGTDNDGLTPLHYASFNGFEDTVRKLLYHGANIDAGSLQLGTPLCLAAAKAHSNLVETLLQNEADVNTPGGQFGSALHVACVVNDNKTVAKLLDQGAHFNVVRRCCPEIMTAPTLTAYDEAVLVECEPLWLAARFSSNAALELLVERGADLDSTAWEYWGTWDTEKEAERDFGSTALMIAAAHGYDKSVLRLLMLGAKVDATCLQRGSLRTALSEAVGGSSIEAARHLLEYGSKVDFPEDLTPLMEASKLDNLGIVKLLIDHGATIDFATLEGDTALSFAARRGSMTCVDCLLRAGATPGGLNPTLPPIIMATNSGKSEIVEMLMDVVPSSQALAALHRASENGNDGIVRKLVSYTDKVDARNDALDRTPLMLAAESGNESTVVLLLSLGADPLKTDSNGQTAAAIAEERGYLDITSLLKNASKE